MSDVLTPKVRDPRTDPRIDDVLYRNGTYTWVKNFVPYHTRDSEVTFRTRKWWWPFYSNEYALKACTLGDYIAWAQGARVVSRGGLPAIDHAMSVFRLAIRDLLWSS